MNQTDHQSSIQNSNFAEGSIRGHLFRLAGPMLLAAMVNMLYSIVDRFYIGHMPRGSVAALSGLGLTAPFMDVFAAFINLYAIGSVAAFSMARGRKEDREAEAITKTTLLLLVGTALALTVLIHLFVRPLLRATGAQADTYQAALLYLSIYASGLVFAFVSVGMNGFLNAQGHAWKGMLTVGIGAVMNLILDPILIYVLDLGVAGAAIATVISQAVSAIWVLYALRSPSLQIRLKLPKSRSDFSLKGEGLSEILRLGLSSFTFQFTNFASHSTSNQMLLKTAGDSEIAVMTVLISLRQLASLPVSSLTDAAKAIVAYNYGAGQKARLLDLKRFLLLLCLGVTGTLTLLLQVFPRVFFSIFNQTPDLLQMGERAMHLYFLCFFMMSFQLVGQTFFVGIGRAKEAVFFSFLRKLFVVVPLTLLLPLWMGSDGIFLAEALSQATACTATYIFLSRALRRLP